MRPTFRHPSAQQEPEGKETHPPIVRVFAIVVLYKLCAQDSPTLQTLLAASQQTAHLSMEILLWDNTPGVHDPGPLPAGTFYMQAPDNPGLAHAYNHALARAIEHQCAWLLTLDQDSILPTDYFNSMCAIASAASDDSRIAAIVPHVAGDGHCLSPFHLILSAFPRWFPPGFTGIPESTVLALNSASMLRVDALQEIGGYDPLFALDASDLCLFQRLHKAGKRVYIAGNVQVYHEFALLKQEQRMSVSRYQAMLFDECAFWDIYMKPLARAERIVRLAGRLVRDALHGRNANFRETTLAELRRRLTQSRSRRIQDWKQWASKRLLEPRLTANKDWALRQHS